MARSRRILSPNEEQKIYCRKCQKTKHESNFYTAVDLFLDSNGKMSVCRQCVNEMYDSFYKTEQDVGRTILKMCRILNVRFDTLAVDAVEQQIATMKERGKTLSGVFGSYKSKLVVTQSGKIGEKNSEPDLTYYEPPQEVVEETLSIDDEKDLEYFENKWGTGLTMPDYLFLESEYSDFERSTKLDTHAEEIFVKEICYIRNSIRKKREEGMSISGDLDVLTKLMKSSALTPAQQSSSGKSVDTFGNWIKDIETMTPAEWYDDQEKYRDMDGIEKDLEDIKRSIKNFITDSRDFTSTELEGLTGIIESGGNVMVPDKKEESSGDMENGEQDNKQNEQ